MSIVSTLAALNHKSVGHLDSKAWEDGADVSRQCKGLSNVFKGHSGGWCGKAQSVGIRSSERLSEVSVVLSNRTVKNEASKLIKEPKSR